MYPHIRRRFYPHSGRGFLVSMSDFKCCFHGDSVNNLSTLRRPFNPQFKQITPVAPLGLGRRALSPGYRRVAPLGLNVPNPYHVWRSVFYPENLLILRILIQTIIMSTPHLPMNDKILNCKIETCPCGVSVVGSWLLWVIRISRMRLRQRRNWQVRKPVTTIINNKTLKQE